MKKTIVTPIINTFNSYDLLKDDALPLGTRVTFDLKNGDEVTFELAHKHAYGATNIFVIADCYGEHRMNKAWTSKGGYNATDMRRHIKEDIVPLFPDELLALIIPRSIRQMQDGEIIEPTGGPDPLWVPSLTEMDEEADTPVDIDDVHFDLYNTEKSRVKECGDHGTWWYWLRSATASDATYFENVSGNGNVPNSNYANITYGVCFGFCI